MWRESETLPARVCTFDRRAVNESGEKVVPFRDEKRVATRAEDKAIHFLRHGNHFLANCLPIFLANDELEVRRIKCNATVLCYCAVGNYTNLPLLMTTQLASNKCEGGHYTCSPPKECCYKGCCFLLAPSVYKPPSIQTGNVFNPLFLGHWYFWLAVTATVAGILCACSLWRKHSQGTLCCRDTGRDERASEPDSNGSCYAPPQYSRCNSFHQPPPPYSEVTSKPDLYPLVINYNADPIIKNNNTSTGYLMVQYFRNFIVRPVGSLSATSTNDSISSSFLCNAANEANNIIPPPYSNVGSLEEVTSSVPVQTQASPASSEGRIPRSASTVSNIKTEYHQTIQRSPSDHTQLTLLPPLPPFTTPTRQSSPLRSPTTHSNSTTVVQIRNNPCFVGQQNTTTTNSIHRCVPVPNNSSSSVLLEECRSVSRSEPKTSQTQPNCDAPLALTHVNRRLVKQQKVRKERSQDSTEDEENNFSDLLNLSVCLPSNIILLENPIQSTPHLHELQQYSVTNSMTGSDISSLANLGTPDSPPRATSPTVEMKELLDKIQQLPQQKSPVPPGSLQTQAADSVAKHSRSFYHKMKAKTLYMPLCDATSPTSHVKSKNIPNVFSRGWLSRSAPCTPNSNFVPNFPMTKSSRDKVNSKSRMTTETDGSPLLNEYVEEYEDEPNNKDENS